MKLEPYSYSVDQAVLQFNENSINSQDGYSQMENDKTPGAEYPNDSDSEEGETNKKSTFPNFIPQV